MKFRETEVPVAAVDETVEAVEERALFVVKRHLQWKDKMMFKNAQILNTKYFLADLLD